VKVTAVPAAIEQLRLFRGRTRRDVAAGSRALARVAAELGEDAVVRAVLREGHLPEAGFTWEKTTTLEAPSPRVVLRRPLVRRIYERAVALPPRPFRERDDSWIALPAGEPLSGHATGRRSPAPHGDRAREMSAGIRETRTADRTPARTERGLAHGRVDNMTGPFIVSGGWWNREVHREYHYALTDDGEILWVYYDKPRRRWFLAGKVE
jgi:protein ImuB